MPTPVTVTAIAVEYPGGVTALDGVDLTLEPGQAAALIGANGSGKSTLLRVLAGALEPTRGAVQTPPRWMVGYAAQDPALDPEMSGAETLALFAALERIERARRISTIAALTERFGLDAHAGRPVAAYSGGLRRRLHLALAWLAEPELLLLDEPTADLDPQGRALIWELIAERTGAGGTAVVATHDLAEVERQCARVVVLEQGRVVADGAPVDLVRRHAAPQMVVRLGAPAAADTRLTKRLAAIDGVRGVRLGGDEVALDTEAGARVQDQIVAVLAGAGHEVSAIRFGRVDLAGAYFRLTGQDR